MNALGEEERPSAGVIKLLPVVALNRLDRSTKLGMHISEEVSQSRICVRLKA